MRTSTLSPLAEEVLAIAGAPLERAFALPPACYVDPGFLALEHEVLFAREWLCVGRAADIPQPGDYAAYDSPVGPVMAVRQKDGSIATLSRVCRHCGALVGEDGSGSARLFTCPYHKWVYELDGRLRGAPAMGGNPAFAPADRALPRFATEVWQGFVFFNADAGAAPLAGRLASIAELCGRHDLLNLKTGFLIEEDWPSNWKVAFENSCETYHHMGVHRQTLEPAFPTLGVRCEAGGAQHNLHIVPSADGFSFEPGANSRLTGDDLAQLQIVGVYPNLVIALSGATATWFSFTPTSATTTRLRVGWLVPSDADPAALPRERATLEAILAEDRVSCTGVQRGLESRDARSGPLSPIEQTIAEFARYLARRIATAGGA